MNPTRFDPPGRVSRFGYQRLGWYVRWCRRWLAFNGYTLHSVDPDGYAWGIPLKSGPTFLPLTEVPITRKTKAPLHDELGRGVAHSTYRDLVARQLFDCLRAVMP